MTHPRRIIHPNFIIGLVSYILLLLGIMLHSDGYEAGYALIISAVLLGGIHWIGSIIDVSRDPLRKDEESTWYFWMAIVIMVPPIAGMLYYMINNKRFTI